MSYRDYLPLFRILTTSKVDEVVVSRSALGELGCFLTNTFTLILSPLRLGEVFRLWAGAGAGVQFECDPKP